MKAKLTLLILWACSFVVAFLIGKARQNNPPEASSVKEAEVATTVEAAPVASAVEEEKRLPGPEKLSLLEMLYSEDTGSYLYQFGLLLEGLEADTLPLFLEEVEALPNTRRKDEFLSSLMARWGELNPHAAADYLESFPGQMRGRLVATMAASWAKTDPHAAWEYVMEESENGLKNHINLFAVFNSAFKTDPQLALSMANKMDNDYYRSFLLSDLGSKVAITGNFQGAIGAIRTLQPSEDKTVALVGMWRNWAGADPASAMQYYVSMEPGPEKDAALNPLMYGWATKDPQAALAYYLDEVDVENSEGVLKEVIRGWADTGRLMEAAAYLLELPVSKETDEAVNGILWQMSQEDPETAMGWANSLQNEERRKSAVRSALYHWAKENLDSAQAYVMDMPAGEDRDKYIGSLVFAQTNDGTISDSAIPLIEQIEDTDKREQAVIDLAEQAIREVSYAPNVTEENKQQLIEQIEEMKGISDDTRSRAISLIRGDTPEG